MRSNQAIQLPRRLWLWSWTDSVMVLLALLLPLTLTGCATTPAATDRTLAEPIEAVAWMPPPAVHLVDLPGEQQACYSLDDALLLAESLESGQAAGLQAAELVDLTAAFDAEAQRYAEDLALCQQKRSDEVRELKIQIWLHRLGTVLGLLTVLGVAL